jgi:hypothetical protein
MNTNGISHRLFVAALTQDAPSDGKRPAAARVDVARDTFKARSTRATPSLSVVAARPLAAWSWSGWQHTTI